MKTSIRNEIILLLITVIPFIYLATIWNSLPERVPMHWDVKGEIDRWGNRSETLLIPFFCSLLIYGLFLIIPKIDPKKQMSKMQGKYFQLRLIIQLVMSGLAVYILYSMKEADLATYGIPFVLVGVLFFLLGNYMKTVPPNYFIGVRTPWTLENSEVWKETHRVTGLLWFVAGMLMIPLNFIFASNIAWIILIVIAAIAILVPIMYSFVLHKRIKSAKV